MSTEPTEPPTAKEKRAAENEERKRAYREKRAAQKEKYLAEKARRQEKIDEAKAAMSPKREKQPTQRTSDAGVTEKAARSPKREKQPTGRQKISDAGATESGELRCPKCGGQQFTAKRSKKGKIIGVATVGVGALAAPKSQVKCVTCGTMYKRG